MNKGTLIVNGIDYSNGGGSASGDNYSTEEQKIGTWIDGKPLYRKVVHINALPSSATTGQYPHRIENIDKMVSAKCYHHASNNNVVPGVSLSFTGTQIYPSGCTSFYVDATNINITVGQNRSSWSSDCIIEYTKTTDVAVASLSLDDVAPLSVEDVEE